MRLGPADGPSWPNGRASRFQLHEMTGVIFMYGGKSDSSWVNLSAQRLAAVIPHFKTKVFPKLNHFGIDQQAPQEVARAVSDYFLSDTISSIVPATT